GRRKGAVEEADFVQPTKEAPACQNSGGPVAEIQIESGLRCEGTQVLLSNDCPVQINDSEAGCLVISKGDVLPRICDNEPGRRREDVKDLRCVDDVDEETAWPSSACTEVRRHPKMRTVDTRAAVPFNHRTGSRNLRRIDPGFNGKSVSHTDIDRRRRGDLGVIVDAVEQNCLTNLPGCKRRTAREQSSAVAQGVISVFLESPPVHKTGRW